MKVLFINSLSADYVQDLTYAGLVKVLGKNKILDMPWNKKYHIPYKKYPKNLGYIPNSLISSLTSRTSFHFDAVFVGSSKVESFETYIALVDKIPSNVPVIFIDGGDQPVIGGDLTVYERPELYQEAVNKRPFDYIFKREYLVNKEYGPNVFPLPMSFNFDHLPTLPNNFKYDVSFWAVESYPIRTEALALLENKFDCKSNGTGRNQKFSRYKRKGPYYLKELASCKIILNFRGGGWDTLRYWEVPAVGRLMITQRPGILIPNDFIDGKHVIHCKEGLTDLIDLCAYYLKNETKREEIAQNGALHLKKYHTDVMRTRYILEHIHL